MIGIPRPKEPECEYCKSILGDRGDHDIPFKVERCDEDGEEMKIPSYIKPYAQLLYLFEGDTPTPYINAAATIGEDGWAAMLIEIRYCPYCGRDLWKELNGEE